MKSLPVILTSNFITVINGGKSLSLPSSDGRFASAVEAFKNRDFDTLVSIIDKPALIAKYTQGRVKVFNGFVMVNDKEVEGPIVERILGFAEQGLPFEPLVKLLDNLYKNTDENIRAKLFQFIEHNNLPITENGAFIVYKLVKADGSPPYYNAAFFEQLPNGLTKSVNKYRVGGVYTMPRENAIKGGGECSSGAVLYAGNKNYFGGQFQGDIYVRNNGYKMLLAEVYPQDVCNVSAIEASKLATCKIRIISEYNPETKPVAGKQLFDTAKEEVVTVSKPKIYGKKPDGSRFYNVRKGGRFVKRS